LGEDYRLDLCKLKIVYEKIYIQRYVTLWLSLAWHVPRRRLNVKWCVFIWLTNNQVEELREHSRYLIATTYFLSEAFRRLSFESYFKIC
jgi:hypothetical protein